MKIPLTAVHFTTLHIERHDFSKFDSGFSSRVVALDRSGFERLVFFLQDSLHGNPIGSSSAVSGHDSRPGCSEAGRGIQVEIWPNQPLLLQCRYAW